MEQEVLIQKKPIDYLKMIFRRKLLIALPVVAGIIIGIIACNVLPKMYQSSTLILVEEGRVINPLIEGLAVSTSIKQRLSILREQILGWDRINQLISKLNLATHINDQQDFENLVKELRRSIKVNLKGPNIVNISYIGSDPTQSMNIVKTITDIFIAENLKQQNQETENAIEFINDQLGLYQKKLKQSEVVAMEDRLKELLLDSTEKHPLVIQLRREIDATKEDIKNGNYNLEASSIAGSDEELATLKSELKKLREDIATASIDSNRGGENRTQLAGTSNDNLYKLLLLEKVEKVTMRDEGVNEGLYNELLKRLETAKLTQRLEASKEGTKYTILDPARLPLKPAKPNKPMVLFMCMFMGFCAGLVFVFLAEIYDHSFLGVDDARNYLELPILGSISKIVTEDDLKTQRMQNIKVTSASALVGAILVIVIIFNVFLAT